MWTGLCSSSSGRGSGNVTAPLVTSLEPAFHRPFLKIIIRSASRWLYQITCAASRSTALSSACVLCAPNLIPCNVPHSEFCSAMECLMCRMAPKMQGSQFCSDSCKKNAHKEAPLLLEVYSWDPKYYDSASQRIYYLDLN